MWYTSDEIKIFNINFFYSTPSNQSFFLGGGGVNRNFLVHLSVAPSVSEIVPVQIFLMERNLKFRNSYFTQKIAYDVVVSHDFYPRSFGKSRSLEGKEHNFVLSISFFYWETFEVPTLYKDFLWPEDVNDFNPRPFVQVQGHWKENMHIFCLLYTYATMILLYIKRAYDLRICQEIDL